MTIQELKNLLIFLERKGYCLIGPRRKKNFIFLDKLKAKEIDLKALTKQPFESFKKFFIPAKETLFRFSKNRALAIIDHQPKAFIGLSVLDLRTLNLWRQVFEKDFYWQERFKNMFLIGYGPAPEEEGQFRVWHPRHEEDFLEHVQFDIFLMRRGNKFQIFTGSRTGQKLLDELNYRKAQHIQFAGVIKEGGIELLIKEVREKIRRMTPNHSLWQELGQQCIECGKCTIICPTCFCFDCVDKFTYSSLKRRTAKKTVRAKRERQWAVCFYDEFSEIAGNRKFLENTAQKIYFWYYHKFVRIPDELSILGCVGCGRCTKVCPVGINIFNNLERIKKEKD